MKQDANKYVKNFDLWNENKKTINTKHGRVIFKERDIWWCSLGCNIGSEEDGKHDNFERPVIIFRIFDEKILWVIPLTTQTWPAESRIHYAFTLNGITRTAEIHQLRLISRKRLNRFVDTMSFDDFQMIRKYVIGLA